MPLVAESPRQRLARLLLPAPGLGVVIAFGLLPLGMAVVASLERGGSLSLANYVLLFTSPPYPQVLANTAAISILVTTVSVLFPIPACALFARSDQRTAITFIGIVASSLWISYLVKVYSWEVLLAANGPINTLLQATGLTRAPILLLYTAPAVILVMIQLNAPFAALIIFAGMRRIDWDLVTAAETLGSGFWMTFKLVYWPQMKSTICIAWLLTYIRASSVWIVPALLGGPSQTMVGQQMATEVSAKLDPTMASVLGVVLTTSLLVLTWIILRLSGTPIDKIAPVR